ncbi:unnamed protein product [marine sediment metagenome]|uniref:Helix-turn-helix domain-containing protein n=1 Tax=marine sediment metagenome TaxID=412755 RepID=X1TMM0_9ZZZZ
MKEQKQTVPFNPNEVRYLNDKEASEITGKAVSTLRNERSLKKGIPFIRMGGSIRYSIKDIVSYMDGCRIQTGQ